MIDDLRDLLREDLRGAAAVLVRLGLLVRARQRLADLLGDGVAGVGDLERECDLLRLRDLELRLDLERDLDLERLLIKKQNKFLNNFYI